MVCIFVITESASAYEWGGGGYNYDPSSTGGDSGTDGGSDIPDEGDSEFTLEEWCLDNHNCTIVRIDTGIACYRGARDDLNTRKVLQDVRSYYGYGFEYEETDTSSGYKISDIVPTEILIKEAFFGGITYNSGLADLDAVLPYTADCSEDAESGYDCSYEWSSVHEYAAYIPWIIHSEADDPRLYRYEGQGIEGDDRFSANMGCRAYGGYFVKYDIAGVPVGMDQNKEQFYSGSIFSTEDMFSIPSWDGTFADYGTDVVWDEDPVDCANIGGTWSEDETYGNQQCCGDDYVWVMNRPLTEDERGNSYDLEYLDEQKESLAEDDVEGLIALSVNYCLYGTKDETTGDALEPVNMGLYYTCPGTEFDAYDDDVEDAAAWSAANEDTCYDDEGNLLSTCAYQIATVIDPQSDEQPTDLGKWSSLDGTTSNPQVCYVETDLEETSTIPAFAWADVNDVGDLAITIMGEEVTELYKEENRATTICEKYLGGKWTGGHCCGNKYDYGGDFGTVGYYDESFSEATPITYDTGDVVYQYACLQGEIYDGEGAGTPARYTKDNGTTVELLNAEGTWYGCNMEYINDAGEDWYKVQNGETSTSLITDTTNIASCTVQGSYLCNYNYTDSDEDGTPESEEWEWYSLNIGDEGDYVENVLGYKSGDTFTSNPPVTPWAEDEGLQPYGCCAANRCWDGTACVDEYSEYSYDDDAVEETPEVVAICSQGSWSGPKETKYDWYANTDAAAVDYCFNNYACVCSTSEDDETYCTDNEEYVVSGCTMAQDFYSNDHFCEAIDGDDDGTEDYDEEGDTSQWTSRTKFLAFQLLEMADGTEYTLFCDKYDSAVNNYVDLEPIAEEINSVCILKQDDEVTVGITLNSQDMSYPMGADLEETLFDSNGFIDAAVEEEVDNCDDALAETQTERFGEFFSCDGSTTVWYNSVLNATIYSRDGLSASPAYPDVDSWQGILDEKKDTVIAYITDNELTTQDGSIELNEEFIGTEEETVGMETIADYNRFYYSTENSATIIGVEDIKYNGDGDNRYYMAVLYDGPTLDCEQVYAPYEDTATMFCDSTNGIVLERSPEGSAYWRSLTAGFRAEE